MLLKDGGFFLIGKFLMKSKLTNYNHRRSLGHSPWKLHLPGCTICLSDFQIDFSPQFYQNFFFCNLWNKKHISQGYCRISEISRWLYCFYFVRESDEIWIPPRETTPDVWSTVIIASEKAHSWFFFKSTVHAGRPNSVLIRKRDNVEKAIKKPHAILLQIK